MSKVNFFSLGGLQENGKNLYVLEVDEKLFVLDCGLKYPTSELYGVDVIVNDISYLVENKDRIVGVFLSHAHDDHIGGVSYLLKEIDTKIYGSKFTLAVLNERFKEDDYKPKPDQLIEVTARTALKFDDVVVRFFEVAHNIPDCYGVAVKTPDGYVVYAANYNFDQNSKIDYAHMFRALAVFAKEGVLALLTESLGANNETSRGTILEVKLRLTNIISQAQNRLIFTLFSSDILKIQQIVDIAVEYNKKIAIIGRKTQKIVNQAMNLGYLNIPEENLANLKFMDSKNKNNDKDLVVLVTGERHEPYFMLQRMARGIDKLIKLEESDKVIILTKPFIGTEKMAARTLDIIYHVTSNVIEFSPQLLPASSANREEIKEMINILTPKYVIPVIGEYRHQYAVRIIADCIGYTDDQVIIADNGDILSFVDGKYVGVIGDVASSEVLIDGKAFKDVGDVVMRDRELLAEDGVVLITANINPRTKTILVGPEVVSKGFTFQTEDGDILLEIKKLFMLVSSKFLTTKFINWSEFKTNIKNEISHFIYKTTKRNPIIIPVLISTDLDLIKRLGSQALEAQEQAKQSN
ncbi:MAG: ribonuclease J [Acholeplasmatales bacterium]|nr:ribonuclease J [Acholeplasmatales bacterium]